MITQERVKQVLDYDKITGIFTWEVSKSGRSKKGSIAGSIYANGYLVIGIDGKRYQAHRLAWFYCYGEWPTITDHKNGVRTDNMISNLRSITSTENSKNTKIRTNNTSGFVGVSWNKKESKWRSQIKVKSKTLHLGYFEDKTEAIEARKEANIKYGFHNNHGRS